MGNLRSSTADSVFKNTHVKHMYVSGGGGQLGSVYPSVKGEDLIVKYESTEEQASWNQDFLTYQLHLNAVTH